jgi:hypothetical protein
MIANVYARRPRAREARTVNSIASVHFCIGLVMQNLPKSDSFVFDQSATADRKRGVARA